MVFFCGRLAADDRLYITPAAPLKTKPADAAAISILFVGDTSFGENYPGTPELLLDKGYDYPLAKVAPLLAGADLVIANLETPITDLEESPFQGTKGYIHWTDVRQAPEFFKKYNLLTFSLANNHSLDYGLPGLEQTLAVMSENNLQWFGAGLNEKEAARPLEKSFMLGEKPFKMVVIGAFEYLLSHDRFFDFYAEGSKGGTYRLGAQGLAEQIRAIKKNDPGAYVILFPHWGRNYSWKTEQQTEYGRYLIKAGADLIIGHGGHASQEIEKYQDRWIIYGLGNFVFLSAGRYAERQWHPYSFAAKLIVTNQHGTLEKHLRLYPLLSDNLQTAYQPRPLNLEEFNNFLQLLLGKSQLPKAQLREISRGQDSIGLYVQFQCG